MRLIDQVFSTEYTYFVLSWYLNSPVLCCPFWIKSYTCIQTSFKLQKLENFWCRSFNAIINCVRLPKYVQSNALSSIFVYQESIRNLEKNQSTAVSKTVLRLEGRSFQISIPLNLLAVDWVFKKFFKTERAILLDYHIWLKDKWRSSVLFSVRLASGIKRVWMGLSDNWQMAKILTDNWHLPWVLPTTDEEPDCPLFSKKTRFKALNSIGPVFSSDNVIKCAFFGVILAARHLSVIFR